MCAIIIRADSLFSTPTVNQSLSSRGSGLCMRTTTWITTSHLDIWIFFFFCQVWLYPFSQLLMFVCVSFTPFLNDVIQTWLCCTNKQMYFKWLRWGFFAHRGASHWQMMQFNFMLWRKEKMTKSRGIWFWDQSWGITLPGKQGTVI